VPSRLLARLSTNNSPVPLAFVSHVVLARTLFAAAAH